MEVPGLGSNCGWSCWPRPQPQQGLIGAASATYAAACGNSRFLTPWPSPGIQPASSQRQRWVLNLQGHNGNSKSLIFIFIFCPFFFVTAKPATYGGSQARSPIGTVAAGLCHSARSEPHLWPTPQLTATPDPSPLSKARNRTYILMDTSQIFPMSHDGNFPLWLSGLQTWLISMRMRTSLSGLRILHCCGCGVGRQLQLLFDA